MAGNSVIGALRVDLGLDTAKFEAGLKEAQGTAAKFGTALGIGLAAATTAAVGLAAAFAEGVRQAIDHADALSKAAQKAGLTTEALSQLEYAAKLSDVSLEGLTGGLEKLSKSMADAVITPTSTAALAFKALGISVTDAAGKLRPTNDVLNQLADRFARMPDGATKTAIAMQVLGRSGAELIPLLNGGSAALRDMAAESDRTGNTISTGTGKAAEDLNDTITRLQLSWDGLINDTLPIAIPALQNAADTFTNMAAAVRSIDIQGLIDKLIAGRNQFENFSAGVGNSDFFKWLNDVSGGGPGKNGLTPINRNDLVSTTFAQLKAQGQPSALSQRMWWQAAAQPSPPQLDVKFIDSKSLAAAEQAQKAYQRVTDSLERELDALHQTDREQQIANALAQAHVTAASKQGQVITALAGDLYDQKKALDAANEATAFFGQQIESAFEGILDGSKSATDALGDMVKALEQAVLQAALLGTGPLGNIFGGAPTTSGQTGGFLGSLFSGLGFGGGRAAGGPVTPGAIYRINENTPNSEYFAPAVPGYVIPSMPANNNAASNNVQVIVENHSGSPATTKREKGPGGQDILRVIVGAVARDMTSPGGQTNRAQRLGFGAQPVLTRR